MSTPLDKLNRLRANAGKNPLKSWKASQQALQDQIAKFEADGFTDTVPGANVETKPETTDPEIAANLESEPPKPLSESAMTKNIDNSEPPITSKTTQTKGRASLARGLDTDSYARHSRERVRDNREKERKEAKQKKPAVELSENDKKQIKDEAASRGGKKKQKVNPTGAVDPKKDPEKAKRQLKHIEDKQAARAGKPKKETNANEVTVADIARELNIDPKVARAKLRRHEDKLAKLHTKGQDRWTFPKSAKDEIVKILR